MPTPEVSPSTPDLLASKKEVPSKFGRRKPFDLKSIFPFESHFLTIAGHRMHYVDEGQGPVVILLHGNPTWAFYYRSLIAALRDRFRVIAPDYIGLGLSDHPIDAHFRAIDRISHLQELIKNLGITEYSLVMHDWGGSIGTGVAVRDPAAVRSLIYLNTTLTETESLPFIIKRAARPLIGKFLTKTTRHFLKLTTDWGVCKKLPAEVKQGYLYPYKTSARRTAIWDFVADIPFDSDHPSYADMLYLAENIPKLSQVPTLIVWGLEDPCFHREMLGQVARHFPNAEVIEIPNGSHLVLEDAPDIAIPAIKNFLSGIPVTDDRSEHAVYGSGRDILRGAHPLYAHFQQQAQSQPSTDAALEALFFFDDLRYRRVSFRDLGVLINKYQRGLTKLGLVAGDRVIMLVPPGIDFLALSYAVMARGAVPVYLDPGMGYKNLCQCIQDVNPQVFIGSHKAQLLRLLRKDLFRRVKFSFTAGRWSVMRGRDLSFLQSFSSSPLVAAPVSDIALIAFTSGATGIPKGVVYTPGMIEAQLKIFKDIFGLIAGAKDVPLLPVFSLFNLAAGIGSVFAPMDPAAPLTLDPRKIIRIIQDLNIQYSFGSPTLWNKIAEYGVRSRQTMPTLQKVLMAGAPVSREVLQRVREAVPQGEVFTPYGATEALPVTLVSSSEIMAHQPLQAQTGEQGTYVGKRVPGVALKVIRPVEAEIESVAAVEVLSPLQIGEIIVQGENISPRYLHREDATRMAKIKDGSSFWHRMGDMGYLDSDGGLYFCGRKAHRVVYRDHAFYSVPCERIFNAHHKVRRSALVTFGPEKAPAIVVEPHPRHWPVTVEAKRIFMSELQALASGSMLTKDINRFFFHESFPVDARHNAKIFRDKLGEWANRQGQE